MIQHVICEARTQVWLPGFHHSPAVAAKSAIGEVDDAWGHARLPRRKADWPLQECTTGEQVEKCPKDKLRDLTVPQALIKQLARGSLLDAEDRAVGS